MSSFVPQVAAPSAAPPDPTKHVNYTQGMVLGVADFTQEFAYHSGRIQWAVRDLLGYGTVCGLRVATETISGDSKGPRVTVEPGVAINPQGQMIRVTQKQCAYLNNWLSANKQQISSLVGPSSAGVLTLYVVLCYRECPTDQVPIPGEPCRSADEAMAASRLTDDFRLELHFNPPDQREEDALRDFVSWLSQVEVSSTSSTSLDDFEAAIRNAAQLPGSPPSPPDFMFGSPPLSLTIPAAMVCTYWRAAFRIWATELRPDWLDFGKTCGDPPNEECVLLAELSVPVIKTATGDWQVDSTVLSTVHEERRPYLVPLSLLQEWVLCGHAGLGAQTALGIAGSPFVVAAGSFNPSGATQHSFNGLTASLLGQNLYFLRFNGFTKTSNYSVKGTPLTSTSNPTPQTFEVIPASDSGLPNLLQPRGLTPDMGIAVRVMQVNNQPVSAGFTVEISQY